MNRSFLAALAVFSILFMSGCASPTKMAFHDGGDTSLNTGGPIYLMTATLKNEYKTSHTPKLLVVNVEKDVVNGSEDRINFTMDEKARKESEDPVVGNSYYLRMRLNDGNYVIRGLTSTSTGFLINGVFFAPLHADVEANGSGVYYLGHVDATVRERSGEEFKAGPSVPLIDQSVVGASGGTFDIRISDQWKKDKPVFIERFPLLAKVNIKKAILPPFDKDKAQKWWEEH